MARRLVVQPQVDLDIQAAAIWYEDQRVGLGMRFLDELDLVFQRIESNPRQFSRLEGDREGRYSIRINEQFCLCFRWADTGAEDVEILDYH
jgi:Txe/YoeB family toxin of Txe-Axe toxin-antitoxin module